MNSKTFLSLDLRAGNTHGATRNLSRRGFSSALRTCVVIASWLGALPAAPLIWAQTAATNPPATAESLNREMNAAIEQVKIIINQPVQKYARTKAMKVSEFSPGWFHEGATKPHFKTVDIRQTQEFPYDNAQYVTSDLNPGVVFIGRQLEFNAMTKYFYTDRSLPKKRLTATEMLEVNRLYRIIGRCEAQLNELENPPIVEPGAEPNEPAAGRKYEPVPKENYVKAAVGVALVLLLYFLYRKFR